MAEADYAVDAVRSVGSDTVAIDVTAPPGFDARPGQFVKLTFRVEGQDESRFYTISSPSVEETFEITVEIDPEGAVGPLLTDLSSGDPLEVTGPFGNNYYEDESRVLILAGGPGVGPAVGIAERAITDGGRAAVVYRDEDPVHESRLEALAGQGALVRVLGMGENLEPAVASALADGGQLFVYGFADFIDAATVAIEAAGGDAESAKIENFG